MTQYTFCKQCHNKLTKEDIVICEDIHIDKGLLEKYAMCPYCGFVLARKEYGGVKDGV